MNWSLWRGLIERVLVALFLLRLLSSLLLIAIIVELSSGPPILVEDDNRDSQGKVVRRLRFRMTGKGTKVFRALGRFLRRWSIDEGPTLWNALRGELRLSEILWNLRGD